MQTLIADAAMALFVLAMVVRQGQDAVSLVLAGAFLTASAIGPLLHGPDRIAALSAIDYAIVIAMGMIWAGSFNLRARMVGYVGLAKLALRWGYAVNPQISHFAYAVAINVLFICQAVIAGGFADELGRRVDHLCSRVLPRSVRLLWHVEG